MFGSFLWNRLAFVILLPFNNFTRHQLHDVSAWTTYKIGVEFNYLLILRLWNLLLLLRVQVIIQFKFLDLAFAFRAMHWFIHTHFLDTVFSKTFNMNLMPAFWRLNHCFVSRDFFLGSNLFITKFTHSLVYIDLHLLVVCFCTVSFDWIHKLFNIHFFNNFLLLFFIRWPKLLHFRVYHIHILFRFFWADFRVVHYCEYLIDWLLSLGLTLFRLWIP
jgi:hypothetical protein